jgi:3-carboxy-cis,cis-muconate cycloisomerase
MPAHATDSRVFRDLYSTPEMHAIFDDARLAGFWLEVEAALARAQARVGVIPRAAAEEIGRAASAAEIDLDALREGTNLVGYPILPLVRRLAAACRGDAGRYVHWGATTQDIMDTANVLQLREALAVLERDLDALAGRLAALARRHRDTVMAGRTHGQHALPITFGFKLAVWVDELRRHAQRLAEMRPRLLRCQFAGAAGTLASLGRQGRAVHHALAEELGLAPAAIAWHTARDGFGEWVAWCGLLTATLGKMANQVASLQQTEFGELEEPFVPGKGSSSTMPQKRNPILCETVAGIARLVAGQVPVMLAAMMPEHERAMGEWHTEWDLIPHVCLLTGAALGHSLAIFEGLRVHAGAMRRNLDLTGGLILAEAVMMRLAEHTGRQRAHDLVYDACLRAGQGGTALRNALLARPEIMAVLSVEELDALLDPAGYTGLAGEFVDEVVGGT